MANDSIAPVLLVAMPQLIEENFHRAVVLLVEHSPEGALGLVLNRQGDLGVAKLCHSLEIEWSGDPTASTDWGGPVQQDMGCMLFSAPRASEVSLDTVEMLGDEDDDDPDDVKEVIDGVWFGMTRETLRELATDLPDHFRLFLGYAGWGPGQLEDELARGDWILAPAEAASVFAPPPDLWTHVIHSLGIDPTHLVSNPGVH